MSDTHRSLSDAAAPPVAQAPTAAATDARGLRDIVIDEPISPHLRKITDSSQQTVGNTRRPTSPSGNLARCLVLNANFQQTG